MGGLLDLAWRDVHRNDIEDDPRDTFGIGQLKMLAQLVANGLEKAASLPFARQSRGRISAFIIDAAYQHRQLSAE